MYDRYLIKKGESLETIAKKFSTDTDFLKDINNIPYDDFIRAGMEIVVPKSGEKYFDYYKIEQGDSLYQIAKKYNINPELLANMNGLEMEDYIYPDQEILIPKSDYSYYITKEGDTLDTASTTMNSSVDNLLKYNDVIYLLAGQLLVNKNKS